MLNLQIVEEREHMYKGHKMIIYSAEHPFHGTFYGWRVGDKLTPAYYRHNCVAYDDARAYIDRSRC